MVRLGYDPGGVPDTPADDRSRGKTPTVDLSDRYLPLVHLGESELATTHIARSAEDGTTVVLRQPVDALAQHSAYTYQLERTALEMLRVKHPHIVRVLDTGRMEGLPSSSPPT